MRRSVYRSKKTGEEKVKTQVYIRRSLYEKVVPYAVKHYGVQRGALSMAVEEALELWLSTHATTRRINPRLPLRDRFNAFIRQVEMEMNCVPVTIPQAVAEKCIKEAYNIKDMRMVYQWLHRFYEAGLIKPLTIDVLRWRDWQRNKSIELVAKMV